MLSPNHSSLPLSAASLSAPLNTAVRQAENSGLLSSPSKPPIHPGEVTAQSVISPVQQHGALDPVERAKQNLTGVVIWPRDIPNDSLLPEIVAKTRLRQLAYGNYLHTSIVSIADKLNAGKITTFESLWKVARSCRFHAPNLQPGGQKSGNAIEFMQPRTSPDGLGTPLNKQYAYIKEVIFREPEIKKNLIDLNKTNSRPFEDMEELVQELKQSTGKGDEAFIAFQEIDENKSLQRHQLSIEGKLSSDNDEPPIPLTMTKLCSPSADGKDLNLLIHTFPKQHERIRKHLEHLFVSALNEKSVDNFKKIAARMYWWSAHACFDVRGSAAKTEIFYRALYKAKGIDCPLWKPGVSADLEAMIRTEDQWLEKCEELQWSQKNFACTIEQAPVENAAASAGDSSLSLLGKSIQQRLLKQVP